MPNIFNQFVKILFFVCFIYNCIAFQKSVKNSLFQEQEPDIDENTYSNILEVQQKHCDLDLFVAFDNETIIGSNNITFISLIDNLDEVDLDIQGLKIVQILDNNLQNQTYDILSPQNLSKELGDQLKIKLNSVINANQEFQLTIEYYTTKQGSALSWLKPEQTSTKTLPYLFSQCEDAHCRSIAPLQDTPQIKSTYNIWVTVKKPIVAFVTGNFISVKDHPEYQQYHIFEFNMPWNISSYLIAIVAGNLVQQNVENSNRIFVITEPDGIANAVNELSNSETYLQTLEAYIGNYTWNQYKIIIMPPSFPLGGMENPLLTFASPSIIVGDKSGTTVVIHEMAHSWTGNLVTCRNWRNMWINEGFTVFLERKTLQTLKGEDFYRVEAYNGNASMYNDIQRFGLISNYSSLFPAVNGTNPDQSQSSIPYQKGFHFLAYIETLIGSKLMKILLQQYVQKFSYQSIVWEQFQELSNAFIKDNFPDNYQDIINQIQWNQWIVMPGYPLVQLNFSSILINQAQQIAEAYIVLQGYATPNDYKLFRNWYPNIKQIFLQYLMDNSQRLTPLILQKIDQDYQLTNNQNKEILWMWFKSCILAQYNQVLPNIQSFLGLTGRMKQIRPLYQAFVTVGQRDLAIQYFNEYKNFYHPIAVQAISNDLGLNN